MFELMDAYSQSAIIKVICQILRVENEAGQELPISSVDEKGGRIRLIVEDGQRV